MRVHRLIFRLDFRRPNFQIIDTPGTVMKILSEMGDEKYWPEFKDSSTNRVISGAARDEKSGVTRQFSVEPTSLHFMFESPNGLSFSSLLADNEVAALFKGVQSFCASFGISELNRAGVRFIALDSIKTKESSLLPKTTSLFDRALIDNVKTTLGEVTDVGVALDGVGADKLGYHFRFGPYVADEAKKYFSREIEKDIIASTEGANFVCDLDFFETNFSMTVRASQWCKVPIDKAQKILESIPKQLSAGG